MIGFVIVNYNDALTTIHLLENIKKYRCLSKIVVVDNLSTDDSFEQLKKYESKKIAILRRKDGRNFGGGVNYGLKYLKDQGIMYSFVSNSDVEIFSERDLKTILSYKNQGSIIGPVIREHTGYNRGWKVPSNWQLFLSSIPFFYRFFLHQNQYSEEYYNGKLIPVEVVSFCFFFVSIKELEKVDYLDEKVFLYFEENIMSRKLNKQGIYLCNEVSVFHNHSVTISKNLNRARKYLALSQSRRYFARVYNEANFLCLSGMWIMEKVGVFFLRIIDFFQTRF